VDCFVAKQETRVFIVLIDRRIAFKTAIALLLAETSLVNSFFFFGLNFNKAS